MSGRINCEQPILIHAVKNKNTKNMDLFVINIKKTKSPGEKPLFSDLTERMR